jgi:uroporphyrin-III C-methyltransferase
VSNNGKLTLVGAGPGAADLITIRGINAIRAAHVVLYDALANEELLAYADLDAEVEFVGKRAGAPSYTQEEINEMIVDYAHAGGGSHVVRLKGGDPFVYGRGYEEIEYALSNGLEVEVVPGVSSAFAVPALLGVPVTSRGVSRAVHIVTATTRDGELSPELEKQLNGRDTLVIFMGFRRLSEIVAKLTERDMSGIPVLVIQSGSTKNEKIAMGPAHSIVERVQEAGLSTPALIVIGKVVALHPEYRNSSQEILKDA